MKKFLRNLRNSKTLQLGFAITLLGGVQTYLPDIINYIPEGWRGFVTACVGIAIIVLRYLTTQSLDDKLSSAE